MTTLNIIERLKTDRGDLQLQQRGEHYEIISNGTFLMATYNGESERELVRSALAELSGDKRVLIGGLGVGFSLQEALKDDAVCEVKVVEIEDAIIKWNHETLAPITNHAIEDKRTTIIHADLTEWIYRTTDRFNAICLDIDNGPDWTVYDENGSLYEPRALKQLRKLLLPGGVIAFWSAQPSEDFVRMLNDYFDDVRTVSISQPKGPDDIIYLAKTNPSSSD
ncbi:spermine/spermidine synthase [Alkalibacillus almallahensis]|uniref:spermine/spermidine synthase domain-containing protein n=1 Tax=Alkalibacillus almallahensis TaxID=1379154 RepID=UPI001423568E|nr:spermine/spermidine synthase [Alkalibacillus almallahensis]NIK12110.1 spermidine synthase [Alkalibacillus almallahensis]